MKATKKIVFFGAMSSILLIGAANAETHVATKGYADTHVAGAEGPNAEGSNDGQIIRMGKDASGNPTYEFMKPSTEEISAGKTVLQWNTTTNKWETGKAGADYLGAVTTDATANAGTIKVRAAASGDTGYNSSEFQKTIVLNIDGSTITTDANTGQLKASAWTASTESDAGDAGIVTAPTYENINQIFTGSGWQSLNDYLDIPTTCTNGTQRCALTTTQGGLKWEPLTTPSYNDDYSDTPQPTADFGF